MGTCLLADEDALGVVVGVRDQRVPHPRPQPAVPVVMVMVMLMGVPVVMVVLVVAAHRPSLCISAQV